MSLSRPPHGDSLEIASLREELYSLRAMSPSFTFVPAGICSQQDAVRINALLQDALNGSNVDCLRHPDTANLVDTMPASVVDGGILDHTDRGTKCPLGSNIDAAEGNSIVMGDVFDDSVSNESEVGGIPILEENILVDPTL